MEVVMNRMLWLTVLGVLAAAPALGQQLPPPGGGDGAPPSTLDRTDEGEAGEPPPDVDEAERARQAAALAKDPEVVRQVEVLLKDEGYLAPDPDGRFDDQTRDAVSKFQESRAIHVSGEMDFDTLAALGVISGEGGDVRSAEQAAEAARREPQSSQVPKPDVMPELEMEPPDEPGSSRPQ
jgi:peptidoglycan hydrolase-like protein with peptidoglycan-binding domain